MTTLASFWNLERSLQSTQMTRKEKTRRRIRKYALKKKKVAWMLGALQSNVDMTFLIFLDLHNLLLTTPVCKYCNVWKAFTVFFEVYRAIKCIESKQYMLSNNSSVLQPYLWLYIPFVKISLFISPCQPVKF